MFLQAFVKAVEKLDQDRRQEIARVSRVIWQVYDWDGEVVSLDLDSLSLRDLDTAFWEVLACPILEEDVEEEEEGEFNVLEHSLRVFDLQDKIRGLPRICRREAYI